MQIKKQICFVGFGEAEIEALQPLLSPFDGAWNWVFAPDGASALDVMVASPFHAIVTNLSASGLAESDFLPKAAAKFPRTLRFVLGDVANREAVVSCVGAAHQFISRPWKPAELISIIERSLALDSWLSNDKLRLFIPRLGKLPGLPATYFEVLKKAESPISPVEAVAEVIARDPALTARLLQMVNSPACGLKEKITSPHEAVTQLGLEMVKSLVLCLQLFAQSAPAQEGSISLDQLWQHSFTVAKIAANIVLHCIASERMASDAYTAGLLHNIGQIVLATNLAQEYSTVVEVARKKKCPLPEIEMELLGVTSNQVGAYLLGLWGMPLPLVEAAALHHIPGQAKPVEFTLLTVVHIANVLAYEDHGSIKGVPPPKLDVDYLAQLDLPEKTDAWRKLLAANPKTSQPAGKEAPSRAPEKRKRAESTPVDFSWLKKLIPLAGIAAVGLGFVALKKNGGHVSQLVSSAVAANNSSASATPDQASAAPAQPTSVWDSVKLQSIIYTAGHPVALINGQALEIGEHFNDIGVVSITQTSVVLAYKGEQKTFAMTH